MTPGTGLGPQPERIGRYHILERIGKGAMGIVYSARDEVMDRIVALKVMMADLEGEPETRARFYREAQAAGRLLHPNIITIFDMGEDEGRIYIVMEFLKGDTLAEFLRRPGGVSLEEKVGLMVQVCEGLGAAHAHGIFHRDVKPGNLFVLHDGTLKILDFGVARLATSTMTASGFIIGTPDYMSPEQARGRDIDQRSDIFSAAGVFYYMLSGRKPFAAPDLQTVLRNVQVEDPPPLPETEVPAPLFRLIMKSLSKDVALRHQRMAEFAADLTRFRRTYEAETRQIAMMARERYASIEELIREQRELCEWLGLRAPEEEPPAARRLREEHPAFVEQGREALMLVPFARPHIAEIAAALCAEHQPLSRSVARLRDAREAVAAAEQSLAGGRPAAALAQLDLTSLQALDAPRVRSARESCQLALEERRARAARLSTLAQEARTALGSRNWPVAVALADEALQLDPEAAEFPAVRQQAREAIEREKRDHERNRQRALDRAHRAITDRRFDLAGEEIARARQMDAPNDHVEVLEHLLAEAQQAVAAEAALARRATEAIGSARTAFQGGRRDEAVAVLQACLDVEPAAPGVRRELDYLQAEIRRLVEAERRRVESATHVSRATDAAGSGDFVTAEREAAEALALDPGHVEAARVHALAQAARRAEATARERRAMVAERLTRARSLLLAGSTEKASREVQRALQIEAGSPEALDVLAEIGRIEAEREAARDRLRQEHERARRIRQELKSARDALRADSPDLALAAVNRVLTVAPQDPDALSVLRDVDAARERRAAARDEDDTVAAGQPEADEDDTVEMAPVAAGGEEGIVTWISSRLKTILMRRGPGGPADGSGPVDR